MPKSEYMSFYILKYELLWEICVVVYSGIELQTGHLPLSLSRKPENDQWLSV